MRFSKSLVTNLLMVLLAAAGWYFQCRPLQSMGFYGFSGAITNWLAIYMLFERVPGLYGSGVIPLQFESFKDGIKRLIMGQFFTAENLSRFLSQGHAMADQLEGWLSRLDLDQLFDAFVAAVESSSLAGMLNMIGGAAVLEGIRQPFKEKVGEKLKAMLSDGSLFKQAADSGDTLQGMIGQIEAVIDHRLAQMTPKMVKEIIQEMIRKHLGWLVVWGGVFGGLIGLVASYF